MRLVRRTLMPARLPWLVMCNIALSGVRRKVALLKEFLTGRLKLRKPALCTTSLQKIDQ